MTANYSHCIHNWPVKREIGNSFKFRRVGSARYWHDALWPLLRIARFLLASWPVQRSSVEVTSKFRCGFNRHQPLLENLSVWSVSALFLSKRKNHISYIAGNNYDKSFVKQKDV